MFSLIWHRYIFLIGIIGLATGMLFGTAPTSIPQIILSANWLLEGGFLIKWQRVKSNKVFWLLIAFYALHLIGMLYTQQTQNGISDLRNKLPLLILPLLFFTTKPLTSKELKLVLSFYFLGVIISSFCCYAVYAGYTKKIILDVRSASVFMSHIRFSLFIAFAVAGMFYAMLLETKIVFKAIYIMLFCWLLFFMYTLEMATGFVCLLIVVGLLFAIYSIKHFNRTVSLSIIIFLCGCVLFITNKAISSLNMYTAINKKSQNVLLKTTDNGRIYLQDTAFKLTENGNLIGININYEELEKEWSTKSCFPFSGKDKKGNALRFTVLRYLASKGFTKDSVGIHLLKDSDIENIERGVSNFEYAKHTGLVTRWHELVWEYTKYKRGENPSGHTLTMRLEFWNTACFIIQQHPVFGVGTGEIQSSFNKAYEETNSTLKPEWRLRCHNQYLAVGVAFGLIGLLFFLFYLLYPAIALRETLHALYWPFFLMALLSFFTEDTLETQSGVTFFIFFQTLFLWLASSTEYKNEEQDLEFSNR